MLLTIYYKFFTLHEYRHTIDKFFVAYSVVRYE